MTILRSLKSPAPAWTWPDSLDIFHSAVGTGGTITGVGEALKARKPAVQIVAVEPAGAAVLSADTGERYITTALFVR